ncbi:MAG: PDZ domain-containing protein [Pedosphaera sp.]|nr:PDZ domain-containing protein [Pedosphaera sp.]
MSILAQHTCPNSHGATACRSRRCHFNLLMAVLIAGALLSIPETRCSAAASQPDWLPKERFKSGSDTLKILAGISERTRRSVVKLDVNGNTVALGTIIDSRGFALTKASEMRKGTLTAWLAGGKEVSAAVIAIDDESDVALVKVNASGLRPVEWARGAAFVGQWAITPGTEDTPQALGIVSVPIRRILHERALIGVQMDFRSPVATIAQVLAGLGAEKAGLKSGDVIVSVNHAVITDSASLTETLRNYREGEKVLLGLRREKLDLEVQVEMKVPKTDGNGSGPGREERMNRLGSEVSRRAEGFSLAIQHDTVLQAWQCGGPLLNLDGKAIGINIARAGRVATYALPAGLAQNIAISLKARAAKESRGAN